MSVTTPETAPGSFGDDRWRMSNSRAHLWWSGEDAFHALDARDGIVRSYELGEGLPSEHRFELSGRVLAHATEGVRVALLTDEEVVLFDVESGAILARESHGVLRPDPVAVCLMEGGARVAYAVGPRVRTLDEAGASEEWLTFDAPVGVLAPSPDGARIAVVTGESGRAHPVHLVDVAACATLATLKGARTTIQSLVWAADGARLWAASGKNVLAWTSDGTKLFKVAIGKKNVGWLELSDDEQVVVTCIEGEGASGLDATSGDVSWSSARMRRLAAVRGGLAMFSEFDDLVALEVRTGAEVARWPGTWTMHLASVSPSGAAMVASNQHYRCLVGWALPGGERLDSRGGHVGRITRHLFDAEGARLFAADDSHWGWMWDVASGDASWTAWCPERDGDQRGRSVSSAAFSGRDDSIYVGYDRMLEHRSSAGEVIARAQIGGAAQQLVHCHDRRELVAVVSTWGALSLEVFDDATLERVRSMELEQSTISELRVDGSRLARLTVRTGHDIVDIESMEMLTSTRVALGDMEADGLGYSSAERSITAIDDAHERAILRRSQRDTTQLVGVDVRTRSVEWFEYVGQDAIGYRVSRAGDWFVVVYTGGCVEWRSMRSGALLASVDAWPMSLRGAFMTPDESRTYVYSEEGELAWYETPELELEDTTYEDHATVQTHFGELRQALQGSARDEEGWRQLCVLLDSFGGPELEEKVLPYTSEVLDAWPDRVRVAPVRWLEEVGVRAREPRMRLARVVDAELRDANIEALVRCEDVEDLVAWRTTRSEIGVAGARALEGAGRWESLVELDLSFSTIGNDVLDVLAGAPWLERLEVLGLGGKHARNTGLRGILERSDMTSLRALSLAGTHCRGKGVVSALEGASHLRGLRSLDVRNAKFGIGVVSRLTWLDELEELSLGDSDATSLEWVRFFLAENTPSLVRLDLGLLPYQNVNGIVEAMLAWSRFPELTSLEFWRHLEDEYLERMLEAGASLDEASRVRLEERLRRG